ncbi:hypothetical protein GCM10025331_75580 [Actinoplanes utahensis]|nr:hypothetical protein Aut01nite_67250 [Actinoplanes utahensis]
MLLDEIAGLIRHPAGFGHIVVDEAQDLSPMQCRALARRSRHGSLTVLGDLAQGTTPWAAGDWPRQLAHLGAPDAAGTTLTSGFRVPAAVLDFANRLMPALDVAVPVTRSVRGDGALGVHQASDLDAALTACVRAALAREGSVAVIAAAGRVAAVATVLRSAGIASGMPDGDPADHRVTIVPATLAKGLEFDHVVVVEPMEIVTAEPRGLHRLYVVLTRAVSGMDVLHGGRLPAALHVSGDASPG